MQSVIINTQSYNCWWGVQLKRKKILEEQNTEVGLVHHHFIMHHARTLRSPPSTLPTSPTACPPHPSFRPLLCSWRGTSSPPSSRCRDTSPPAPWHLNRRTQLLVIHLETATLDEVEGSFGRSSNSAVAAWLLLLPAAWRGETSGHAVDWFRPDVRIPSP